MRNAERTVPYGHFDHRSRLPTAPPATLKGVGFGRIFTDRMFAADFSPEKGWHDARIIPPFQHLLHPACCVFHYGAESI